LTPKTGMLGLAKTGENEPVSRDELLDWGEWFFAAEFQVSFWLLGGVRGAP